MQQTILAFPSMQIFCQPQHLLGSVVKMFKVARYSRPGGKQGSAHEHVVNPDCEGSGLKKSFSRPTDPTRNCPIGEMPGIAIDVPLNHLLDNPKVFFWFPKVIQGG